MPIRKENRKRYPLTWRDISDRIRFERALVRCECPGGTLGCGLHRGRRREERHGELARFARGRVILTVAHLDHVPEHVAETNLRALCNRCHLRYDRTHHADSRLVSSAKKIGQGVMFHD